MIWKSNKYADVRRAYEEKLQQKYDLEESKAMVFRLFEDLLHIPKLELFSNPTALLNESEMLQLHHAVKKLLRDIPLQHITGFADFYGRSFLVDTNVLIPRPETEELLLMVIKSTAKADHLRILDIGTGSGCLATSLALELEGARVFASDVSEKALEIARLNADKLGAKVRFFRDDVLNPDIEKYPYKLDIVLSNPPYVRPSEKALMPENVKAFEPELALYAPEDNPLIFYKNISKLAYKLLKNNGLLFFEINEALGNETVALIQKSGFGDVQLHIDLFGKDRFVSAQKKA